ncbi:MAG: FtsH protease activity modulator HflK [bacterium]
MKKRNQERHIRGFWGHLLTWGKYLLVVALLIYLFSGFYRIKPFETGILRFWGRVVNDHVGPGLHYTIPYPFTRRDKIRIQERKRISVGFEFSDQVVGRKSNPLQGEFISGDENILNLEMVLQYFIISPVEYLFMVDNPEALIRSFAKKNLTRIVSKMPVDEILRGEGKVLIQAEVLQETQADLDRIMNQRTWVRITSMNLQNVSPPLEVADAFKDVVTARQDRDRLINEAEGYRYDTLPKTRGRAEEMMQQAETYKLERINQAKGDSDRFLKMAGEYRKKGEITSARLYLETMERVMERINKIFVQDAKDQPSLDLNIIDLEKRE